MLHLHLLGTGAAVSDPERTTTMLAVSDDAFDGRSTLLIDCGGDVLQRFREAGGAVDDVAALIVTHAHPDHCSGFPLFIERLWLHGHHDAISVRGIAPALEQIGRLWDAFAPIAQDWDIPTIDTRAISYAPASLVWDHAPWRVTASPVEHGIDNVGLRIEHVPSGRVLAYSCDTEPCDAVVDLARDADLLVHEATGSGDGHSMMEEAAETAQAAAAKRLLLVHLPEGDKQDELAKAQDIFRETEIGEELGTYTF